MNERITFKDEAGGGWYCNECEQNIHPDMVHSHKCNGKKFWANFDLDKFFEETDEIGEIIRRRDKM